MLRKLLSLALLTQLVFSYSTAHAAFEDALCASLFQTVKPQFIRLRELKNMGLIGSGSSFSAYTTIYQHKPAVVRIAMDLQTNPALTRRFNEGEIDILSQIGLDNARFILSDRAYDTGWNDMVPQTDFRVVQHMIAELIFSFYAAKSVPRLRYNGFEILPQRLSLIQDENGIVIGEVVTNVPGVKLRDLVRGYAITPKQIAHVYKQVREQLDILFANGVSLPGISANDIFVVMPEARATLLGGIVRVGEIGPAEYDRVLKNLDINREALIDRTRLSLRRR